MRRAVLLAVAVAAIAAPVTAAMVAIAAPVAADTVRAVPTSQADIQLSFAPVVKAVMPSVVNVYATRVTQEAISPFAQDPFFQQFFGGESPFSETRPQESHDLGSGVIIDAAGVILTNSHVVHGADDIRISTGDGREFGVDLVLDDAHDDLAVLRVRDSRGVTFPALKFADSDALAVGDLVLAIGNPFGVGQTVTSGIVSAIARTSIDGEDNQFFIQTDAAINPGNSGGALVDLKGELVGINTALFSNSGGSVGIGFAIPANLARMVADAGISGTPLQRPWFGARLQPLTADLANSLGIDPPRGALVAEVAPDGPAGSAGLTAGDVIVGIGDAPIADPQEFNYRFATQHVGGKAALAYIRSGKTASAEVAVASTAAYEGDTVTISGETRFAGATGAALTPAFADDLGLPYDLRGVVISAVEPGSAADRMGLRRGDVILSLQGRGVQTVQDFQKLAAGRPQSWQIELQRDGRVLRSIVEG